MNCLNCNDGFYTTTYNKKFCTNNCYYEYHGRAEDIEAAFSKSTIGAIHEFQVSVDLMRKGWEVFKALSPNSSCDLVAIKEDKTLLVQVTKARKSKNGKSSFDPHKGEKFDILALSFTSGEVEYRPSLPE